MQRMVQASGPTTHTKGFRWNLFGIHFMQSPKNGISSIADKDFTSQMPEGHFRKDTTPKMGGVIRMSEQRLKRWPAMHAMSDREVQG